MWLPGRRQDRSDSGVKAARFVGVLMRWFPCAKFSRRRCPALRRAEGDPERGRGPPRLTEYEGKRDPDDRRNDGTIRSSTSNNNRIIHLSICIRCSPQAHNTKKSVRIADHCSCTDDMLILCDFHLDCLRIPFYPFPASLPDSYHPFAFWGRPLSSG